MSKVRQEARIERENMHRIGTPDKSLLRTTDARASVRDLNKLRDKDFVSSYLERLTEPIKLDPHEVR